MSSSSPSPRPSPQPEERPKPNKIFVTNLDIQAEPQKLQEELRARFGKYGKLESVVVKKSYNNKYSYAFIELREGEDGTRAVNELNYSLLSGKKMRVELQDNTRRRGAAGAPEEPRPPSRPTETCYLCGKSGHFAKHCHQNKDREERHRRSRSREERHKKKSRKGRERSSSPDSRSPKEKKRKIKKSKSKHKKERRRSRSDSS